jgi:hypothetical protein
VNESNQPAATARSCTPDETVMALPPRWARYAVINVRIARGRDWLAYIDTSERYGVIAGPPEYWQLNYVKGRGGPQTVDLAPDAFIRARLGGQQFGIYIDVVGQIHCLPKKAFERELDCRFRDRVKTVDLSYDADDWIGDPFRRDFPTARLGEVDPEMILVRD